MEIRARIDKDGNIELSARSGAAIRENKGKDIVITLAKKKRSSKQNNYYWGAILPTISGHTGHTVAELHEAFKKLFLPRRLISVNGKQVYLTGSTTKLTTGGMTEYVMRISAEAANMGVVLPDPDDYYNDITQLKI